MHRSLLLVSFHLLLFMALIEPSTSTLESQQQQQQKQHQLIQQVQDSGNLQFVSSLHTPLIVKRGGHLSHLLGGGGGRGRGRGRGRGDDDNDDDDNGGGGGDGGGGGISAIMGMIGPLLKMVCNFLPSPYNGICHTVSGFLGKASTVSSSNFTSSASLTPHQLALMKQVSDINKALATSLDKNNISDQNTLFKHLDAMLDCYDDMKVVINVSVTFYHEIHFDVLSKTIANHHHESDPTSSSSPLVAHSPPTSQALIGKALSMTLCTLIPRPLSSICSFNSLVLSNINPNSLLQSHVERAFTQALGKLNLTSSQLNIHVSRISKHAKAFTLMSHIIHDFIQSAHHIHYVPLSSPSSSSTATASFTTAKGSLNHISITNKGTMATLLHLSCTSLASPLNAICSTLVHFVPLQASSTSYNSSFASYSLRSDEMEAFVAMEQVLVRAIKEKGGGVSHFVKRVASLSKEADGMNTLLNILQELVDKWGKDLIENIHAHESKKHIKKIKNLNNKKSKKIDYKSENVKKKKINYKAKNNKSKQLGKKIRIKREDDALSPYHLVKGLHALCKAMPSPISTICDASASFLNLSLIDSSVIVSKKSMREYITDIEHGYEREHEDMKKSTRQIEKMIQDEETFGLVKDVSGRFLTLLFE